MVTKHYRVLGIGLSVAALVAGASLLYSAYQGIPRNSNSDSELRTASVVYTDSGFHPSSISVRRGTNITFQNNSSQAFEPVADMGFGDQRCSNDYRGACAPIPPGGSWTAYFDGNQTRGYHDALRPSATLTITVITLPSDMQPTLCDGVPCKI